MAISARTYNRMIPYLEKCKPVTDLPNYNELSEYEIKFYEDSLKEVVEMKEKYKGMPICLEPMESEW